MHSALVRLQNVFGFFTSVAFAVAAVVALSSYTFPSAPTAEVSLRNVQVVRGRPHYHSVKKEEYAHIKFDLEADFSSLFNWNTKQLFVWVQAVYPPLTPEAPLSKAIIWDTIINSPSQTNTPWTVENLSSYLPAFLADATGLSKKPTSRTSKAKSKAKAAAAKAKKAVVGGTSEPAVGKISLKNQKPKYQITDVSGKLAERQNVTLEVGWNVQPWVGVLSWTIPQGENLFRWQGVGGGRSKAFDMPPLKGKKPDAAAAAGAGSGGSQKPSAGKAEPVAGHQH